MEGTLIRLQVDHLPGDRDPKPVWLWWSRAGAHASRRGQVHWVAGNKAARLLQERALVIDKPAQSAGSGPAGGEADI